MMANKWWGTTDWHLVCLFQRAASVCQDNSGKKNHPTNHGVLWDDGGVFERANADYQDRSNGSLTAGFPGKSGQTDVAIYVEFTLASNPSAGQVYSFPAYWDTGANKRSWLLRYRNDAGTYRLEFVLGHTSGTAEEVEEIWSSGTPLSTGVRYCAGASFDDSAKAFYGGLWIKSSGSQVDELTDTTTNNMSATTADFTIGCSLNSGTPENHLNGTLHILAISNLPKTEGDFAAMVSDTYGHTPEPEIKVYIDWNNDGDFGDSEEDCSDDVIGVPKIYVGRAGDLDFDQAATCEIRLDNSSGKYSSEYSGGPVYGNIIPNIRIKVDAVFQGSTYTRFKGFYKNLTLTVDKNKEQNEAVVRASGPLSQFAEANTDIAVQSAQRTDQCMQTILTADGWAGGDTDLDTCLTTMLRWFPRLNVNRIRLMRQLETMEKGRLHESFDGKICLKNRNYLASAPYSTPQATFDNQALKFWNIEQLNTNDGSDVCNYYRAEYNTFYVTPANTEVITITDVENDKGGSPPYVPASSSIDLWVTLSQSEFEAIQTWGTPTKKAHRYADGSGSDYTAWISIVVTGYAQRAKLHITNSHGFYGLYLTKLICLGTAITLGDSAETLGDDSTSIGKYGRKEFKEPGEYYAGPVEAQLHADFVVTKFKDDRIKLKFEVDGTYDANHMMQCLTREVGDRIHVEATLADTGLAVDSDFVIDSIELRMLHKSDFKMIIVCTKAPTATLAATGTTYTLNQLPTDPYYIEVGGAASDINTHGTEVDGGKLQDGTVTYGKISVSQLSAISADMGSLTAGTITGATIRTSASNPKIEMTSSYLSLFNSSGNVKFRANVSTGNIEISYLDGIDYTGSDSGLDIDLRGNPYSEIRLRSNYAELCITDDGSYNTRIRAEGNIFNGSDLEISCQKSTNAIKLQINSFATTIAQISSSGFQIESGYDINLVSGVFKIGSTNLMGLSAGTLQLYEPTTVSGNFRSTGDVRTDTVFKVSGTEVLNGQMAHQADPAANVTALAAWAAALNAALEGVKLMATS